MTTREDQPRQLDCSVVIPVFNRGEALAAGSESLRAQSIGAERFEVIYVDDGSTDGYTPALINEVAAGVTNARVFHEPASGSPGRPRNVGVAQARGEFVFFSDHDDWFDPRALERLVGWARKHDSDVVVGKVVAHGGRTRIPRLFAASRASVPAPEAMISLTPHKLFRRSFLEEHDIRFPEGKRRLEDHHFVTHAYLHAKVISVYADHVCYHHNDPGTDENFSQTRSDPALYVESNVEVIDLIRRHTEHDPDRRDAMLERPVLHELIKKAAPGRLKQIDGDGETRKYRAIATALREVPPTVIDRFGVFPRATACALLRDDDSAVRRISEVAETVHVGARVLRIQSSGTHWLIDYRITLLSGGAPVMFGPGSKRRHWRLATTSLAAEVPEQVPLRALTDVEVEVFLAHRQSALQWPVVSTGSASLRRLGRRAKVTLSKERALTFDGRAVLDLAQIGDERLGVGRWDLTLRVDALGLNRGARLRVPRNEPGLRLPTAERIDAGYRVKAIRTQRRRTLAIRVQQDL
ncbi:MAG TPA: glycosyltransferase family 2 protein [Mycobacteriales bacterium]|nr:glycosyltransferase family 2 protein [Mycobacteriales bacterium]